MDGYARGSPLNCPLMPAPDTPHHWLCRPASPSADVMSGPGWQESWPGGATSIIDFPLFHPCSFLSRLSLFLSLYPLKCHFFFSHFLLPCLLKFSSILSFISFLFCSLPPFPFNLLPCALLLPSCYFLPTISDI